MAAWTAIDKFVAACWNNNITDVVDMLRTGQVEVEVNDRSSVYGYPGLVAAMAHNNTAIVRELLSSSAIRLDITTSSDGWTGLHIACIQNHAECVRLFLDHPACTSQIVTIKDKDGRTAEMIASSKGHQDCVRMIKEFMDRSAVSGAPSPPVCLIPDSTEENIPRMLNRLWLSDGVVAKVDQARLQRMTMGELGEHIEQITILERQMKESKQMLDAEQKQEVDKLAEEFKAFTEKHERKLNTTLDRHEEEKTSYERTWTENKKKKQALQAELQQRLDTPGPQPAPSPPLSLIPECPICLESMRPPLQIFNCSNGHLICSACMPRMSTMNRMCHCQQNYVGRATAMEQMVRQILGII